MTNRFPDVVIGITASSWAGFAIWLGTDPGALLPAFGVDASTPQMLTEVRAFYGGVELAIAISMIVLWRRKQQVAALLIGGLPLVGSACGRLSGLALDGFSTMHLGFASLELLGASFCAAAAILLRRHNSPSQIGSGSGPHDAIK